MSRVTTRWLAQLTILILLCADGNSPVQAAALTPGNILTIDELFASPSPLREFTSTGVLVQTFNIPQAPLGDLQARGIVVDANGNIQVYNGTFTPYLTTFNPVTSTVLNNATLAGWSTVNNITYGGSAAYGNSVFVTDMMTAGAGAPNGLIQFNINTYAAVRFGSTPVAPAMPPPGGDYIKVALGLDCNLYGQWPGGAPQGYEFDVFDPTTLAYVRTINVGAAYSLRAFCVDTNGDIFAVAWVGDPNFYQFDTNGNLKKKVASPQSGYADMKMNKNGQIIASSGGNIVLTDRTLANFTVLNVGTSSPVGTMNLAWVEAPGAGGVCSNGGGGGGGGAGGSGPAGSGSEGSFVGCDPGPPFGLEGAFGLGGGHIAAPVPVRPPMLLGPFLQSAGPGLTLSPLSAAAAGSPPAGAHQCVFNFSYGQQVNGGGFVLGGTDPQAAEHVMLVWTALTTLTAGASLSLAKALQGIAACAGQQHSSGSAS